MSVVLPKKKTQPLPVLNPPAQQTRIKLDEARLQRILDPKARTIGIDRDALDAQVREKQERLAMEREAEEWMDKKRVQQDLHAVALQHETAQLKARQARDLQEYRNKFQKKGMRKDADLSDPNRVKASLPTRIGDDDPRLTVCSLQKFAGEEPGFPMRQYAQRMQMRDWVSSQIEEKNLQKERELQQDDRENAYFEAVQQKQWDLSVLHAQQRKMNTITTADFNRKMAEQKRQESTARRRREVEQNLEEIQNMLDSDILSERTMGHDRSKGMQADDIAAIKNQQAQQINQRRAKRVHELEMDAVIRARGAQDTNMGLMMEQQVEAEKRATRIKIVQENMQKAAMNAAQRAEQKRLYAAEIGEDFFRPFGVTAR